MECAGDRKKKKKKTVYKFSYVAVEIVRAIILFRSHIILYRYSRSEIHSRSRTAVGKHHTTVLDGERQIFFSPLSTTQ